MKGSINKPIEKGGRISFAEQAGYLLAFAAIGFFLAGAGIKNRIYPFGGALVAACPIGCLLSSVAGVLVRCILLSDYTLGAKYIAVSVIIALIRYLIPKQFVKRDNRGLFAMAVSITAYFLVNGVNLIIDLASFTAILVGIAETLFAGGGAYFLHRALELFTGKRSTDNLSGQDCTALAVGFFIVLMSFSPYEIAGLSPARVGAIIIILMFANYGRASAAATVAIVAGFALSIGSGGLAYLSGGYTMGGLVASVFSPLGNFASATAFFVANLTVALTGDFSVSVLASIYEGLIASAVFLAIPSSAGGSFVAFFEPKSLIRTDGLKHGILMRLDFVGAALSEVSDTVEAVAAKLRRMNTPGGGIVKSVCDSLCVECESRERCFGREKKKRERDFKLIENVLKEYGNMEIALLPSDFADTCIKKDAFAKTAAEGYSDFLLKKSADAQIDEFRSIVVGQFKNLSSMLFEISSLICESHRSDIASEQKIYNELREMRLSPIAVSADIGSFDKMAVSLRLKENGRAVNSKELEERLSLACGRPLSSASITSAGDDLLINLCEETDLNCEFAVSCHSCDGNELCGDSYRCFTDGRGNAITIISDGMGSGGRAAVDGAMASGLMARLIKAGLGFESALSIVNSAMLYKSEDESLATVDICSVNLYSGKCDFYKAGAAKSLILQKGRIIPIESNSLPIGILKDISFERLSEKVSSGAIILMMSDGAADVMGDWLKGELRRFDGEDIDTLVKIISAKAKVLRKMYKDDDITVIAMKITTA